MSSRRRRSRRSPTTRSCRTATPGRWSRRTARSTGCACLPSTRRARSGTSSTAARAPSGSGPYGINVPTARTYVPGTNVLTTTWHTPGGWILVHDALTMGPRQGPDTVTPHTRPPADDDAEHLLVRTVECLEGSVEIELVCEPAFDYGREPASWTLVDDAGHAADASGAGQTLRLSTDLSIGIEGSSARARHVLSKGERAFCALSWADGLASPPTSPTPPRASRRPSGSGATGWPGPASPTTRCGTRSSARRSRSRA